MNDKLTLNEDFDIPGADEAADALGYDPDAEPTLEDQGWEYVASKDVYDEDGFRDSYMWYRKDGNNRFFFSSDVDYGDPEYFDWETEGDEAAQEWFDSYGEDEDKLTFVDNREEAILHNGDDPGFDGYDKVDEAVEDNLTAKAEIDTPRGTFYAYKGTWKDFENEDDRDDWGFWFDHYTDDNKHFKIMHNHIDNSAIAVLKEGLNESKGGFVEKYRGYSIHDAGDRYVITNENGLNVGETRFGIPVCRGMIDDMIDGKEADKITEAKRTKFPRGFNLGSSNNQNVKVRNPYNYTIQELSINNKAKTFERGNFSMGRADIELKNRQEYEDIVDLLKDQGYTEVKSDYHSLRNKTRKGIREDTVKQGSSWVNKGKEGTHGKFKTKKEADAQRKAMFAQGFTEDLDGNSLVGKDYATVKKELYKNGYREDKDNAYLGGNKEIHTWWKGKNRFIDIYTSDGVVSEIRGAVSLKESLDNAEKVTKDVKESYHLEPRKRPSIDGKVWWAPFDLETLRYSTIPTLGRYKTKKDCQYAIDKLKQQIKGNEDKAEGEKVDESLTEDADAQIENSVASRLIEAINDEWKTIDLYNSIISELSATDGDDYKKMIPVIEDIVNEENVHVGQLQKALELISPDTADIAKGEKEAEGQIGGGDPSDDKKALVDESCGKSIKESFDDDDIDTESERWEDIYEYGSDDDDYDDFELAGIYGGDLTYCPICGRRLEYDEDGDSFCPKCKKSAWALAQERRKLDKERKNESVEENPDDDIEGTEWYSTDIKEIPYGKNKKRIKNRKLVDIDKEPIRNPVNEGLEDSKENATIIRTALASGSLDRDAFIDYVLTNTPDEMLSGAVNFIGTSNFDTEDDLDFLGDGVDVTDSFADDLFIDEDTLEDGSVITLKDYSKSNATMSQNGGNNTITMVQNDSEHAYDDCDDLPDGVDITLVDVDDDKPLEEEKPLQEMGPLAATLLTAIAPVVADKVMDKVLPEEKEDENKVDDEVHGNADDDDVDIKGI